MDTTGGGAAASPFRGGPAGSSPDYKQLALYLAGNALTIVIGLLIWNLNTVLADFRDSMLYALLCSIALRPAKEWLVARVDASLADPRRSVAGALLALLALPLTALVDAWQEGKAVLAKWRQAVQEEIAQRQAQLKLRAAGEGTPAGGGAATPASPRTPRTAAAAAAAAGGTTTAAKTGAMQSAMPSLAVYGHAAVKVLKSRRTSKKRRKQRQAQKRGPEGSSVLFRWLFRTLVAWLLWEWVRESWSATVQLVLLVFTAVLVLGLFPLLLFTTNRYLSATVFSPVKTPTASATQATGESHARRPGLQSVSPPKRPRFSPFSQGRQGRGGGSMAGHAGADGGEGLGGWWQRWAVAWLAAREAARDVASSLESGLRAALRTHLHALVALTLILALFVGTTGLAVFLSVRVAQEGRVTVLAVRDVFPAAWAGMAASTPLLADAAAAADSARRSGGGPLPTPVLPAWVASYQAEALALAQQALPAIASWGEQQFHGFVERQNLTAALGDIRLLYERVQGPRLCSEREREKRVVALARAEVAQQAAHDAKEHAQEQLRQRRAALREAVVQLQAARMTAEPGRPAPDAHCAAASGLPGGAAMPECPPEPEAPAFVPLSEQVLALEAVVVQADTALKSAKAAHKAAVLAADSAESEALATQARLGLCTVERHAGHHHRLPGLAGEVGGRLQQAYAKLWRRQLREGLADMRAAGRQLAAAARGAAARGSGAVGDLSSLQRLAQAAADPLIAVGRVAGRLFAGSLGSTTAAALMGGLGVLRLGMGVVKFGMQLMLFLALLYYLLAAPSDPLLAAAGVLPLSDGGRQRTAVALNRALGGVLISSVKLIAFHGCFSWLTFRVMGLPLTYTASVASAVCALLPFVPTYAAALPGCVVLLAQGRLLAALLFFGLHFLGYYIGDTAILEDIPGGHPYMLSLGILGGIYAFENPLQGCLLGPILLSLLSVFYNLHSEFMGGERPGERAPDGGPLHRLWSLTPGGSAGGMAQTPAPGTLRSQHVRLAPTPTSTPPVTAAQQRSASLRIHVPAHEDLAGPGYSPAAPTSGDEALGSPARERQPTRSSSLTFRGMQPLGPAAGVPNGDAGSDAGDAASFDGGQDEEDTANSFSFLSFGVLANKPHDD